MSCKNEDCEGQTCRTCSYSTVDTLLESDDMKAAFTTEQINMLGELLYVNERRMADEFQRWIFEEYSPEVQKWLVDIYADEIQNWLEDNFFYD